ncbi:MAG: hypothetical protein P1P86_09440 [Bacteroidales bacterium]|nr:hypothetical protein [Bacteroidales bacterium]
MHNESGLKRGEEMEIFWTEVFGMMKATAPGLQVELRAKELPESIIQIARELKLDFTVTTKYWMEQLGLPFHPTHINRENQLERRHGYADMLRYPQEYKILWRLWSGGTQRVLLWGDPGYVRRFSESTHLYDGVGFEINEPLATKMEAQPHDEEPFDLLNLPYRYYDYEFERYWHFFQVFGRLSYNPDTSPEVWIREFNHRFGKEAGPHIQEALHKASAILPRVMAACAPYGKFPTTMGWAEMQRFGDLPQLPMLKELIYSSLPAFIQRQNCLSKMEQVLKHCLQPRPCGSFKDIRRLKNSWARPGLSCQAIRTRNSSPPCAT